MSRKYFKLTHLIVLVSLFLISSVLWASDLEVHIINVGHGDSMLIISPTGNSLLIDAGDRTKGRDNVYPYLQSQGISEPDYIVASHYHSDHIKGIIELIDKWGGTTSAAVYDRGGVHKDNTPTFQDYVAAAGNRRTTIQLGDVINLGGGVTLTCIAVNGKTKNETAYSGKYDNSLGVVLLLDYLDFQMYFGGDCEDNVEPAIAAVARDVDVYKVSHHGSDTSSTQPLLDTLKPEIAVLSVGNSHDLPDKSVQVSLQNIGCYIYQTNANGVTKVPALGEVANGNFKIVSDGKSYTVSGSDLDLSLYPTDDSESGSNDVIFSEVHYDSPVYRETEGEWFELYNSGSSAVDISGWTIEDNAEISYFTIPQGTSIGAGCYLLIADDGSWFYNQYGCNPDLVHTGMKLRNDGDFLYLKKQGSIMDQVAWGDGGSSVSGWGSSSKPDATEGKTIQRSDLSPGADTDTYADWISNNTPDPNCGGTVQIALNKSTLSFNAQVGETAPDQTFSIANNGCGTLNWTVNDDSSWLSCTPATGSGSAEITVTASALNYGEGVYSGIISVSSAGASNSPQTIAVTFIVGGCPSAAMSLSRSRLNFGVVKGGITGNPQAVYISKSGCRTMNWTVSENLSWLSCSPTSGTDSGSVSFSINNTGLGTGTYSGTVSISSADASNSPRTVEVTLTVYSSDSPPFGSFDTPISNSTVSSSIAVTGWALDDVELDTVKLYRQEGSGIVYIGDAQLVEGARPDVEQAYPDYPMNYQAGWGYMLLTNFLPNGGNGTVILDVRATDISGREVSLGTHTIICDNANAVKPFGAIDTPTQGGTASGDGFINWGWVLTPQPASIPIDGSTINVFVDGVNLGHPNYNVYRSDIASLFPGYANTNGAIGYFYLDTTAYSDGVHTIQWTARDSNGNTDGIGSRYFTIENSGNRSKRESQFYPININLWQITELPVDRHHPIEFKRGFEEKSHTMIISRSEPGDGMIRISELERLEINLNGSIVWGYLETGKQLRPMPIGSTIRKNSFYWSPGPGFLGEFRLFFIVKSPGGTLSKREVVVNIEPGVFR